MLRSISQALPLRASLAVFLLLGMAVVAAQARPPVSLAVSDMAAPAQERQQSTQLLVLRAASLARGLFVAGERP